MGGGEGDEVVELLVEVVSPAAPLELVDEAVVLFLSISHPAAALSSAPSIQSSCPSQRHASGIHRVSVHGKQSAGCNAVVVVLLGVLDFVDNVLSVAVGMRWDA